MIERKVISESRPPCLPLAHAQNEHVQILTSQSLVSSVATLLPRDQFNRFPLNGWTDRT